MIKFKLISTGRIYIALEHTVNSNIVYGQIESNGKPVGRMRSFLKEKIELE